MAGLHAQRCPPSGARRPSASQQESWRGPGQAWAGSAKGVWGLGANEHEPGSLGPAGSGLLGQGLPSPHTCTLQSHLEGTRRTMSPISAQPAMPLLGCDPECEFKPPGVSLWGHFQVLGKPEVSCLQLPPRGDAHAAHTLNSRSPGHPCPAELQRWKCPVFTLPEIFTSHYPQEAVEQLKGGYETEEGNFKFYPKFLGFTLNHPVEAGGREMRSEPAESSPGH